MNAAPIADAYREAAGALVRTFPPLSEEARRKLLAVTVRSARRRKLRDHEGPVLTVEGAFSHSSVPYLMSAVSCGAVGRWPWR